MKVIKEVRLENLNQLIKTYESQRNLCEMIDREPAVVSQMVNGRGIGDKFARHIEERLNLPNGWMDTNQLPGHTGPGMKNDLSIEEQLLLIYVRSTSPSRQKIIFDLARDLSLDQTLTK